MGHLERREYSHNHINFMVLKNNVKIVHREQTLLRRYYDFLSIKILNGLLYCYGTYNQTGIEYKYRIKYNGY